MVASDEFIQLVYQRCCRRHVVLMKGTLPSMSIHILRHERKFGFPERCIGLEGLDG